MLSFEKGLSEITIRFDFHNISVGLLPKPFKIFSSSIENQSHIWNYSGKLGGIFH